ncbi:MAG: S-methyl-5-thioribose-1-phosphate isomerase, partial [Methanomicrobiales archaeon]|nr:S-methyl-5-thioribose-1-phosphate isomerase [Methanomicrobiales archaeon]
REKDVVIEKRGREEVTTMGTRTFVPKDAAVQNPAFDATPMDLVSAIITENGIIRPPFVMEEILQAKTK